MNIYENSETLLPNINSDDDNALQQMEKDKQKLTRTHYLLKKLWNIPFTNGKHKFGISDLFNILPGGSTVTFFARSQYIIIASRNNLPREIQKDMYAKMVINWILGIPPIIGTVVCWFYDADGKIYVSITNELDKIAKSASTNNQ